MSSKIVEFSTTFNGEYLKRLRLALGDGKTPLSRHKLALRLGCTAGAIQQWEDGLRRNPEEKYLAAMRAASPTEEIRALFGPDPEPLEGYANPRAKGNEFWAHLMIEQIFNSEAPETVREATMAFLEKYSERPWCKGPPSPRRLRGQSAPQPNARTPRPPRARA